MKSVKTTAIFYLEVATPVEKLSVPCKVKLKEHR
jgi:hypothetical protein